MRVRRQSSASVAIVLILGTLAFLVFSPDLMGQRVEKIEGEPIEIRVGADPPRERADSPREVPEGRHGRDNGGSARQVTIAERPGSHRTGEVSPQGATVEVSTDDKLRSLAAAVKTLGRELVNLLPENLLESPLEDQWDQGAAKVGEAIARANAVKNGQPYEVVIGVSGFTLEGISGLQAAEEALLYTKIQLESMQSLEKSLVVADDLRNVSLEFSDFYRGAFHTSRTMAQAKDNLMKYLEWDQRSKSAAHAHDDARSATVHLSGETDILKGNERLLREYIQQERARRQP